MAFYKTSTNKKSVGFSIRYCEFPFPTRHTPIINDYNITEEALGVGINGKILKCIHRQTKRTCALKILKDSEKARREVILHKKASEGCDFIVQILDIYENVYASNHCLLVVMECMEGGELFNRIRNDQDTVYTERQAAKLIFMIAEAVSHLHHMDIAHRDLEPKNLLFTSTGSGALLKLTDFGFAKEGHNKQLPLKTPCNTSTPIYVAPEMLCHNAYDKACDIWSMGVIMYIILCGYPPFFATHDGPINGGLQTQIKAGEYQFPEDEWKNISQEAKSIIAKMLTVDPVARVTIDWILQCSWFTRPVPETLIDIYPLCKPEHYEQMRIELIAANSLQRRTDDDDEQINLIIPDKARLAQRAAERQRPSASDNISVPLSQIEQEA